MASKEGGGSSSGGGGTTGEEGAVKSVDNLQVALANIRARYQPLLNKDWEGLLGSLRPDEKAKLCVAMAYSIHSLYYMYLKAKGVSPKTHAVKQELEKVQNYMKRLHAATNPRPAEPPPKRTMVVDTAASKRMVAAALSGEGASSSSSSNSEEVSQTLPSSKRKLEDVVSTSGSGSSGGPSSSQTPSSSSKEKGSDNNKRPKIG